MSLNEMFFNNTIIALLVKIQNISSIKEIIFYIFIILTNYAIMNKTLILDIIKFINKIFDMNKKIKSSLTFMASDEDSTKKFRALMHHISLNCKNIKKLKEIEFNYWDHKNENKVIESNYRVIQEDSFDITDNIKGKMSFQTKEKKDNNNNLIIINQDILEIYSETLESQELITFVDTCEGLYTLFLKTTKDQLFIDINWDLKNKKIKVTNSKWNSSVTFKNRFFKNKEYLLDKINYFLNNKKWFIEKGIPHTLGILLHGEPGNGKTGFIKALANLTNKHIININLSSHFNFTNLKKIIFEEEIVGDLIIPFDKRIIVLEDIDCMIDIIKNRDLIDTSNILNNKKIDVEDSESYYNMMLKQMDDKEHNTLSYILNVLDGINESSDRIIVMTTNKPDLLDKAFIRPGRIDINIHFENAECEDIKNILNHYWNTHIVSAQINNNYTKKFSCAEVFNMCRASSNIDETILLLNENYLKK